MSDVQSPKQDWKLWYDKSITLGAEIFDLKTKITILERKQESLEKPPVMEFVGEIQQIEAFILMRLIDADENNITVDGNKARKAEQCFGKIRRYIQKLYDQNHRS